MAGSSRDFPADPILIRPMQSRGTVSHMHTETILIADDDRLILFSLAKGLRDVGYTMI